MRYLSAQCPMSSQTDGRPKILWWRASCGILWQWHGKSQRKIRYAGAEASWILGWGASSHGREDSEHATICSRYITRRIGALMRETRVCEKNASRIYGLFPSEFMVFALYLPCLLVLRSSLVHWSRISFPGWQGARIGQPETEHWHLKCICFQQSMRMAFPHILHRDFVSDWRQLSTKKCCISSWFGGCHSMSNCMI